MPEVQAAALSATLETELLDSSTRARELFVLLPPLFPCARRRVKAPFCSLIFVWSPCTVCATFHATCFHALGSCLPQLGNLKVRLERFLLQLLQVTCFQRRGDGEMSGVLTLQLLQNVRFLILVHVFRCARCVLFDLCVYTLVLSSSLRPGMFSPHPLQARHLLWMLMSRAVVPRLWTCVLFLCDFFSLNCVRVPVTGVLRVRRAQVNFRMSF